MYGCPIVLALRSRKSALPWSWLRRAKTSGDSGEASNITDFTAWYITLAYVAKIQNTTTKFSTKGERRMSRLKHLSTYCKTNHAQSKGRGAGQDFRMSNT